MSIFVCSSLPRMRLSLLLAACALVCLTFADKDDQNNPKIKIQSPSPGVSIISKEEKSGDGDKPSSTVIGAVKSTKPTRKQNYKVRKTAVLLTKPGESGHSLYASSKLMKFEDDMDQIIKAVTSEKNEIEKKAQDSDKIMEQILKSLVKSKKARLQERKAAKLAGTQQKAETAASPPVRKNVQEQVKNSTHTVVSGKPERPTNTVQNVIAKKKNAIKKAKKVSKSRKGDDDDDDDDADKRAAKTKSQKNKVGSKRKKVIAETKKKSVATARNKVAAPAVTKKKNAARKAFQPKKDSRGVKKKNTKTIGKQKKVALAKKQKEQRKRVKEATVRTRNFMQKVGRAVETLNEDSDDDDEEDDDGYDERTVRKKARKRKLVGKGKKRFNPRVQSRKDRARYSRKKFVSSKKKSKLGSMRRQIKKGPTKSVGKASRSDDGDDARDAARRRRKSMRFRKKAGLKGRPIRRVRHRTKRSSSSDGHQSHYFHSGWRRV